MVAISEQWRRYSRVVLQVIAVATGYYGAAIVGLELAVIRGQVTPLWPPTGVALASLLVMGLRTWPGITLGALAVNLPLGPTLWDVLAISAGNTLAPIVGYLVLRATRFSLELVRLRDALWLGAAAFGGTVLSATVGTLSLARVGAVPQAALLPTWTVWWTGDAMGVLVVTPLLLTLRTVRWQAFAERYRWLEAALLLVLTVLVTTAATAVGPLLFLVFPLLILAAFRLQLLGVTLCALLVSVSAVAAAVARRGPFEGLDTVVMMATLQVFNGAVALTGLLLAAVIAERDRTHQAIQRAVCQLTAALARAPDRTLLSEWAGGAAKERSSSDES